jgi:uncharacterized Ntn-hydrolase superfamily protein
MLRFRTTVFSVCFACIASSASATWSVIALDRASGTIVIASATCVAQQNFARFPAKGLMDVQAIVVPGQGVAAAQAAVDNTRANQQLIYDEIVKGTAPAEIIAKLKADPRFPSRQFGIVDRQGRMAGWSGEKNGPVSLDRQGQVEGTQIFYSIQGNILTNDAVILDAVQAFAAANGELTDRVMAAMEAADAKGGDSRCSCDRGPKIDAPCTSKTAHVAYILQALKDDRPGASYNDGTYSMYISVTDQDITPQEDANPVKTLRRRYDAWKRSRGGSPR